VEGVPLVLPHGPDGTHAGDRPDGCPRLLQAAGFEPEEAVSLNSFRTARASSESFAGLTSLPVSFHFEPATRLQRELGFDLIGLSAPMRIVTNAYKT